MGITILGVAVSGGATRERKKAMSDAQQATAGIPIVVGAARVDLAPDKCHSLLTQVVQTEDGERVLVFWNNQGGVIALPLGPRAASAAVARPTD